jgi:hypothetical protein
VSRRRVTLSAVLLALIPSAGTAQAYSWQELDALGDETGFVRSLAVRVAIEGEQISAAIDEGHADGSTISFTMTARLSDLNLDAAQARESMRSIHPHLGVVVLRCKASARCVTYSAAVGDTFFEFPGPVQFGFFVRDRALAEQALADLRRIAQSVGG